MLVMGEGRPNNEVLHHYEAMVLKWLIWWSQNSDTCWATLQVPELNLRPWTVRIEVILLLFTLLKLVCIWCVCVAHLSQKSLLSGINFKMALLQSLCYISTTCVQTEFCPLLLAGVVHADLKLFLETNLPLSGKKKASLGVSDAKIGAALQEEFTISIQTGGVVAEIIRGEKTFVLKVLLLTRS